MTAKFEIAAGGWRNVNLLPKRFGAALQSCKGKFQAALEEEIGTIIKRTQAGVGVNGDRFVEYSQKYKIKRINSGRRGSPPNLTWSGQMLQAIQSTVSVQNWGLQGKLFFLPSQAGKARYNQSLRKFFGLSKEQLNNIIIKLKKALNI